MSDVIGKESSSGHRCNSIRKEFLAAHVNELRQHGHIKLSQLSSGIKLQYHKSLKYFSAFIFTIMIILALKPIFRFSMIWTVLCDKSKTMQRRI